MEMSASLSDKMLKKKVLKKSIKFKDIIIIHILWNPQRNIILFGPKIRIPSICYKSTIVVLE